MNTVNANIQTQLGNLIGQRVISVNAGPESCTIQTEAGVNVTLPLGQVAEPLPVIEVEELDVEEIELVDVALPLIDVVSEMTFGPEATRWNDANAEFENA
jgi:hypothetical protein